MKAILKHVDNQYILIVDEWPSHKELWYYYNGFTDKISNNPNDINSEYWWRIIAAENLDGVKGIRFKVIPTGGNCIDDDRNIEEVINEKAKLLIDTEVEVTEEKYYYLIRL